MRAPQMVHYFDCFALFEIIYVDKAQKCAQGLIINRETTEMTKLNHADKLRIKGMIGLDAYSPEYLVEWIASLGKTIEQVVVLRATHGRDAFLNAFIGDQDAIANPDFALFVA